MRQLNPMAACRTSQHRLGVNYVEVLEVGCLKCLRTASFGIHHRKGSLLPCAALYKGAVATPIEDLIQTHTDAEPWRIDRGKPSCGGSVINIIMKSQLTKEHIFIRRSSVNPCRTQSTLHTTRQVQSPASSLVGAGTMAAALPTQSGRKCPFLGQAVQALQSPIPGAPSRPADVMEVPHLI